MQELTQEGRRALDDIALRHGVSPDAALTLLRAVAAGGGTMAQFSHPELGGMGQWTAGGMVMVGDMFNYGLKQRVNTLCAELAALLRGPPVFTLPPPAEATAGSGPWWPAGLGTPAASGAQNDMRYAYFPASHRLAVRQGDRLRLYDTGDHQISGVSQQQSGGQSLVFTSQYGPVSVADLPSVTAPPSPAVPAGVPVPQPAGETSPPHAERLADVPREAAVTVPPAAPVHPRAPQPTADDPLALIERLAELHQRGILSDEEFTTKKTELLRRL
jgi:hypothetical protein